jgi:hypothetical protein
MDEDFYVMLVMTNDNSHTWQEFSLPLSLQQVEKWAILENVYFQEIQTKLGPNFHEQKEFLVDNEKQSHENLEKGKAYFVTGNEIQKLKNSKKTKNPFITDSIISSFKKCAACTEEEAIGYLESFSSDQKLSFEVKKIFLKLF